MRKVALFIISTILLIISIDCVAKPTLKYKIVGIDGDILETVQTRLQAKQDTIATWTVDAIQQFYAEAVPEITAAVKPYGYFQATVTSSVTNKGDAWSAIFKVNLGKPIIITTIDLQVTGEGASDPHMQRALKYFPLTNGEIFTTDKYNAAKQFLFELATRHGYAVAVLEKKEVQIDLENYTAKVILHFATGPQYYFGPVQLHAPYFSQQFLTRFVPFKSGDVYSSKQILELQDALANSNLFQQIDVMPHIEKNALKQVPIEVNLIPRKAKQYSFGVGYGTDTGIRGSLGLELRHLTTSGHSFKALIQASQVQNNVEMHYLIPGYHPAYDQYDISAAGQSLHLDNGHSYTGQLAASYMTVIKGWHQAIKLSLQHEIYKLVGQATDHSTLFIPSINWTHNKSNDPIKPTRGHNVNITVQGASKYLAASNNFFQAQGDAKYMRTFFERIQLILHGTLGYTAINNLNNLPLSLQFYTGGTQSVRGYGYNTIGPGRNLIVGSVELRHKIISDWYVAAFFDAGNANDNLLAKPYKGAGVGIVWRTSIGSLELTYAKALDYKGTPSRIQFSMGPDL